MYIQQAGFFYNSFKKNKITNLLQTFLNNFVFENDGGEIKQIRKTCIPFNKTTPACYILKADPTPFLSTTLAVSKVVSASTHHPISSYHFFFVIIK